MYIGLHANNPLCLSDCNEILLLPFRASQCSHHNVNQRTHTIRQNYNNVIIRQLLHVSGLTGPSSGKVPLRKTVVRPFHHPQFVAELSQIRQFATVLLHTGEDKKVQRLFL